MQQQTVSIQNLMDNSGVRFGTSGVRGLVSEMTHELCFAYVLAFLQVITAKPSSRIAIAIDLRPSSPDIAAACNAAVYHLGMHVVFCGALPTPALAYFCQTQGIPGIMVTGSHIPFDRNGIKFYSVNGEITKADEAAISKTIVTLPNEILRPVLPEQNLKASQLYIDRYLNFFPLRCLSGMKLGFYEHSSVARELLTKILEGLGAEVIALGRTDVFVPIDTEAVSRVDIDQARRWANENGHWLRGDITGTLCAKYLGAQAVATPVSCNTAIELCGAFSHITRTRIGSPYVIAGMEEMLASGLVNVVGFEANGGFLLGSAIEKAGRTLYPLMTRDAVLPILALLVMAREKGCKLSQLLHELPPRYTGSDRLQHFPLEDSQRILKTLSASTEAISRLLATIGGRSTHIDQTDGLRIYLDNTEIIHFRPSGNAPELRCYAEAADQERANSLASECLQLIRNFSQNKQ
jgi:phosphomannomutase